MNVRTPVFVYADDPISQAGLEQLLRGRSEIHVVASGQIDDARVAVVACEDVDDAAIRTITGIQRDGCPRVVVVATRLDEEGILAASEAGTLGMLRRSEARRSDSPGRRPRRRRPGERADRSRRDAARRGPPARGAARARPSGAPASLSNREREVLRLLAEGRDTQEIASTLCYSERTVKGVIHEITTRLQLRNRSHAVAYALRNALI